MDIFLAAILDTPTFQIAVLAALAAMIVTICILCGMIYKLYQSRGTQNSGSKSSGNIPEPLNIQAANADSDEDEIIAVIAAAVAAIGEAAGKQYAVRQIRRASGRSEWSTAGLVENTRPF